MTLRAQLAAALLLFHLGPALADAAEAPAPGPPSPVALRVLTLAEALESARAHQPVLRQARAATRAADARADEARSPLLPQLLGSASYQRTTANVTPRPGVVPSSAAARDATFD